MAQMGRPRSFDREQAIQQAMHLFWEQGYETTSLSQLKAQIGGGISAPSFYAAFGSKEALFTEVVECYLATYANVTQCLWHDNLPPRAAIEQALRDSAKMQCAAGHPKGCMVALAAMSATSPENRHVTQPLSASRARTRAGFIHCVQRGINSGELAPMSDASSLGNLFNTFLSGVTTGARDGVSLELFESSIDELMKLWDGHRASESEWYMS